MINALTRQLPLLFLFFILASAGLRFFSFFPAVMDHDESTYMIIGRDILHGKTLYTDVTDTKPVGIFLFYAGLEFLFGNSIFLKRLAFAIVVAATGFLIFLVSKKLFKQNKVAFASGLIYIIYVSIWNYHGRSPNTELLFNLFTITGLLLFLKGGFRNFFFGGLAMGTGFMVKYLVLFDFAAFLLYFFIIGMTNGGKKEREKVWIRSILAGLAFLIPFGLTNLFFWLKGNYQDFFFITFELPGNYGGEPSLKRYFTMLLDFTAKFLPISYIILYVILKKNPLWTRNLKWFFLLWVVSVLIAIYLPGKEFSHYTIQLMLPLSIIAGLFFFPGFQTDRITGFLYSRKYGIILLGVLLLTIEIISFQNDVLKKDYEKEVAEYISKRMEKGDRVFVSNYQQIIYYLLEIDSPTKYIHSNLLFTDTHKAFNIDAKEEIGRIMNKRPEFVVVQRENALMDKFLASDYQLMQTFKNGQIKLYEQIR